jgi:hypothetical protein
MIANERRDARGLKIIDPPVEKNCKRYYFG